MTQQQALKVLQAKHGKNAAWRDNGKRSSPEMRQYHKDQIAALGPKPEAPMWQRQADTMTIGEFRALYREYCVAADAWKKERDQHWSAQRHYRYTVGKVFTLHGIGSGISVEGEGDTWEHALTNAGYKLPEKRERPVPTCKKCSAEHWPFQACG